MTPTTMAAAVMLAVSAFAAGSASGASLVPGASAGPQALRARLDASADLQRQYEAVKARVQAYVERHKSDPDWIVSRLQMYWQGKHTKVFVKNGYYDHAEGQAPVPTVRYTGARDSSTAYAVPALEDVKPYMGEGDRLYLQNRNAPGKPWEWAEQAKTGRVVEAINMRIAELARDAAFLYWYSGDEAYAKFAYDIFDTYMSGMYYRETPVDLNRGHDQTLVGLQSFEVIHEDIVGPLTETYDFLRPYVQRSGAAKQPLYDGAFKKWADLIIVNGVPWNNWNLLEARHTLKIAAVLGDDARYQDRRGRQHYARTVVEGSGLRQWSLQRLLDFGYDQKSAMWNESPGYAINVLGDYLEILEMLERLFGIDLLPQMPVLSRAAMALPQYLLPNGRTVGFGDTKYEVMRTGAVEHLLEYAQRHGHAAQAKQYAALLAALRGAAGAKALPPGGRDRVHALLAHGHGPVTAAESTAFQTYQTPTYYAPKVSWLVQRNGYEGEGARDHALVISQVGSTGNHAQANGIAMELFAQGISIAPESGRGSGYFQNDYREYYSQFPSHNTVVVDGKSTYQPMKSNHPLTVQAVYPAPATPAAHAFPWVTFSDVSFREPETDSDQSRVLGTVRLDEQNGYFVDIFRSRRRDGKDSYHDYIYHNLAQSLRFIGKDGKEIAAAPSDKLAFADNDLMGYDYWWNRRSLMTNSALVARFDLKLPKRAMTSRAWLQGGVKREFFAVQAPPSTAWPAGMLPAGLDKEPQRTLVIRQAGEAWSRPFSAVFEAVKGDSAGSVLDVEELIPQAKASAPYGLRVTATGGRRQTIMSTDQPAGVFAHMGMHLTGRYGIAAERAGAVDYLFLGRGRGIAALGYAIRSAEDASATLWQRDGAWYYTGTATTRLRVPVTWPAALLVTAGGKSVRLEGRMVSDGGRKMREFAMPAMQSTRIR